MPLLSRAAHVAAMHCSTSHCRKTMAGMDKVAFPSKVLLGGALASKFHDSLPNMDDSLSPHTAGQSFVIQAMVMKQLAACC